MRAIAINARSVSVATHCVGCGACSLACPAGAIAVDGFEQAPATGRRLEIECARVPLETTNSRSWIVPCFAGLHVATLVEAAEQRDGTGLEITIKDRGLCMECPASARTELARDVQVRRLAAVQSTGSKAITVELAFEPLSADVALPPAAKPGASRRSFLRRLIGSPPSVRHPLGVIEERAALGRLAAGAGRALDASYYPALVVSDACLDHGICAASCPTGALRRGEHGEAGEVRLLLFDAAACVGCGRCGEVCPETALLFQARGTGPVAPAPVVLRETHLAVCARCEEAFVPDGDNEQCPACRKGDALFHDLFSGRRQVTGAMRSGPAGQSAINCEGDT